MTLTESQKTTIRDLVKHYAAKHDIKVYIPVDFTVKGKTAGVFRYPEKSIGFNEILAAQNFEDFIARTVPHEVAHYIDYTKNGNKMRKFRDGCLLYTSPSPRD